MDLHRASYKTPQRNLNVDTRNFLREAYPHQIQILVMHNEDFLSLLDCICAISKFYRVSSMLDNFAPMAYAIFLV